ncbi:MAG: ABC transporter substrate-binding protein [Firmicutes bacterium]|nr:ABC transporter substrate-binding protein [Bacillota bacterium]
MMRKGCFLLLCVVLLVGCLQIPVSAAPVEKIKIAGQFGLVYAPLMVAKSQGIFQKYGLEPVWKEYGSGGAVREALISGEADVGFMEIPPFLIGWDKGCPWKVAVGFVVVPIGLVTYDPEIKSLKDFRPEDKIAVPSPGSIQHILLAMAAEKELGSPNALDNNIVALPHPDACAALISKKGIKAHFTTPPYLFEELSEPGFHLIVDDIAIFGHPFSFNVGVASEAFHEKQPVVYSIFVNAIAEAMAWINNNKTAAAELLAPEFKLSAEKTLQYLEWEGMNYTTAPYGLMGFAEFMQEAGYINRVPNSLADIAFENILAFVGSRAGTPSDIENLQEK